MGEGMRHVREREEVLAGFWWGNLNEGDDDDLVDLNVDGC